MEKIYKFILKISDRNGAIYQYYRDGLNITSYLPWCDLKQIDISFLTEAANNVFNFISHHCTSLYGQLWQQLSNSYSFCLMSLHYRSLVYMWRGCSYSVHKAFIRHTVQQRENAKSAIPSRTKSTVRGRSQWFNADHDRGQILSFSSPSRNHVDRGWSRIRRAQWANVFYKPTCTKYLGRIKFALKINANVVIFIACGSDKKLCLSLKS